MGFPQFSKENLTLIVVELSRRAEYAEFLCMGRLARQKWKPLTEIVCFGFLGVLVMYFYFCGVFWDVSSISFQKDDIGRSKQPPT